MESIPKIKDEDPQKAPKIYTKSVLFDCNDIEIATGEGVFIRSKYLLKDATGFLDL